MPRGGKRTGAGRKPSYEIVDTRETPVKRVIDLKVVEAMCRVGATCEDLAAEFSIPDRTMADIVQKNQPLNEIVTNSHRRGKLSLRRRLWIRAMGDEKKGIAPSDACLIFLNKNENGMSDRGYLEMAGKDGKAIEITDPNAIRERLASRIAGLSARITTPQDPEIIQ